MDTETEDVAGVDDRVAFLEDDGVTAIHQIGCGARKERRCTKPLVVASNV